MCERITYRAEMIFELSTLSDHDYAEKMMLLLASESSTCMKPGGVNFRTKYYQTIRLFVRI